MSNISRSSWVASGGTAGALETAGAGVTGGTVGFGVACCVTGGTVIGGFVGAWLGLTIPSGLFVKACSISLGTAACSACSARC